MTGRGGAERPAAQGQLLERALAHVASIRAVWASWCLLAMPGNLSRSIKSPLPSYCRQVRALPLLNAMAHLPHFPLQMGRARGAHPCGEIFERA